MPEHPPAWPIPTPAFELRLARTALVIVDMQEGHCRPDRGIGRLVNETPGASDYFFDRLRTVVRSQRRLLDYFHAQRARVVFFTIGPHAADGSDLTPWRRRRNERLARETAVRYEPAGAANHAVIEELAPGPDDIVLNKATFGGFASTGIDHLLRGWGVDQLVVCGQATNVCVYMTAAEAADRGYECLLAEDACAAWNESLHRAFVDNFSLLFGRVASSAEAIDELAAGGVPA